MNIRNSVLLAATCLLSATLSAAQNDVVVTFSTPGPDKYADGTTVLDGECYALVWTPEGKTFAGIQADGTAVDPATGTVVLCAPIAKDGRCPDVAFEIDASLPYKNGTWGVYLLDTRVYAGDTVSLAGVQGGKAKVVNAAGVVQTAVAAEGTPAGMESVSAGVASGKTEIPGGDKAKITDIKLIDGNVYLTVRDASPYAAYQAGEVKLDGSAPADVSASKPVQGVDGKEIILVSPAKGSSGFFKVIRK